MTFTAAHKLLMKVRQSNQTINNAYETLERIKFEGMHYRCDIGSFLVNSARTPSPIMMHTGDVIDLFTLKAVRLAILGSTRGTDMQAIIDAIGSKELNASKLARRTPLMMCGVALIRG